MHTSRGLISPLYPQGNVRAQSTRKREAKARVIRELDTFVLMEITGLKRGAIATFERKKNQDIVQSVKILQLTKKRQHLCNFEMNETYVRRIK